MSTQSTAEPDKPVVQEFPKMLYKVALSAEPKTPTGEVQHITVSNQEEQDKKEEEGWSEEVPQPPQPPPASASKSAPAAVAPAAKHPDKK